jgi:hypothetical protein
LADPHVSRFGTGSPASMSSLPATRNLLCMMLSRVRGWNSTSVSLLCASALTAGSSASNTSPMSLCAIAFSSAGMIQTLSVR